MFAVFFGRCVGKHRKGSDSEKLSFEPEAHQPLAELLLFLWHQRKKGVNKGVLNEKLRKTPHSCKLQRELLLYRSTARLRYEMQN